MEALSKLLLGSNVLISDWHLILSEHKERKGPPEALPKFILGRNILLQIGIIPFTNTKIERSAGGSAQNYFGQLDLTLKMHLTLSKHRK